MLIARPKAGAPFEGGQPLQEHCENVANTSAIFAEPFKSGLLLKAAGLLHDLGKADKSWQEYLRARTEENPSQDPAKKRKLNAPVKHAAAGAALALRHYKNIGQILAYLIAGHHAGLPDGEAMLLDHPAPGWSLDDWEKEGLRNLTAVRDVANSICNSLPALSPAIIPPFIMGTNEHTDQAIPFWIRMLFSCLVDADCLDAEAVTNPEKRARRGFHATIPDLLARLDKHLETFPAPKSGTLNEIRKQVLADCRAAALQAPGAFSLTVPTGGGKTLSGMAFALTHAAVHRKRRVIHVIPYTSIIEQTADIFSSIFGEENVCEHHSGVDAATDENGEATASRLAAENWDAPIVVTTSVQFFESLYASRTSKCRKLHNLEDSVIILDEVQLLPVALLAPCVEALRQLVHGYGVTVVLATATQPALGKLNATEIIPDPASLFARLRRTRFILPKNDGETVSWADLAAELGTHKAFLCIVNTRRDAYDLWKELNDGAFHLSTLMCPQHRREVLATIRLRLTAGEPVRVVSTQLVEAGVDIDFPVVYRAIAGMDSLAQAAGRCNREGRRHGLADVHIFIPEKRRPPGLIAKGTDIVREFLRTRAPDTLESPDIFPDYFSRLYDAANDISISILEDMAREARAGRFPFRTIACRFRIIDEDTVPIIIDYAGGGEVIEQIRRDGINRSTLRQAQRYMVSPPLRIAANLERQGRIEPIADGLYTVTGIGRYDENTGLGVWDDDISPESFIV